VALETRVVIAVAISNPTFMFRVGFVWEN
jgi:hypothetical protein